MIIIKKAQDDRAPGTWWRTLSKDGTKTAWMRCPNGHYGTLTDHSIAEDGTVNPSVQCPEPNCNFHDHIKLEGWA